MAVLIKAALGNHAIRKTGQGSGEKFGWGTPRFRLDTVGRGWSENLGKLYKGPAQAANVSFSQKRPLGGFGCMSAVDA